MFKMFMASILAAALVSGCASKKKADEAATTAGTPAASEGTETAISSSPMSFDAQGSDSGKINGLATINFEYDKFTLTEDARKTLTKNGEWISGHPNVNVQIEGHCDSRGSIEYNLALGEKRAKATKEYLVKLGVPTSRLSLISYGKEKPLVPGETEDAWLKNRRANFVPLSN